jgi:hypothetical protein
MFSTAARFAMAGGIGLMAGSALMNTIHGDRWALWYVGMTALVFTLACHFGVYGSRETR